MMMLALTQDQITTFGPLALAGILLALGLWSLFNDLRRREITTVERRLDLDGTGQKTGRRKKRGEEALVIELDEAPKGFIGELLSGTTLSRVHQQANIRTPLSMLAAYMVLGASVVLAGGILLQLHPLVYAPFAVAPIAGPVAWIFWLRAKRRDAFMRQMPNILQLLGQALRAGHALMTGIELVGKQLPDPAGEEFHRAYREQNFGMTVEEALDRMADRVDLLDLRMFVTAVGIQRQTGGDLAEVLDKLAAVIRERLEIFGQVKALTAEGRMSGWVLFVMPFVMFFIMNLMHPKLMAPLWEEQALQIATGLMVIWQLIGLFFIRKIVSIKV